MNPMVAAAGAWLRLRSRLQKGADAISVFDHIAQTQTVLVYMPVQVQYFGDALKALAKLREKRPDWQLTVITRAEMAGLVDRRLTGDLIPYSKHEINFFGLPKRELVGRVRERRFDLALDFSTGLDLVCVRLFEASRAAMRACLDHPAKTRFFNFSIRVNPLEALVKKYESMVKYLTPVEENTVVPEKA